MGYLKLIVGFILLIYSGNFLVKGGVSLAKIFKIPTLVIGLTVVSLGTSLPELFVSAQAAFKGYPEMAIGNVIGSNIANIALVLGITAIVLPLNVKKTSVFFDTPYMIIISILLYILLKDHTFGFFEGLIFVLLLITYVFWTFKKASINHEVSITDKNNTSDYSLSLSILIIIASSVGLKFGAEFLVDGAVFIAKKFNVSETIISVTMIAFGTSVPELATSIIAAIKKEPDISVGNIVGSNIFNILGVLGVTSMIKKINIMDESILNFHIYWMLAIAIILFFSLLPVFKLKLNRFKGLLYLIFYIAYILIMFKK